MVCLVQGNGARILPEFLCTKFGVMIGCPIRGVCPFVTARVVIRCVGAVYYCIYPPKTSKDYCTRLPQVRSGVSFSKIPWCSFPSLRRFRSLRRKCRKWRWGLWYGRGHTRLIGGAFGVSKP